MKNAENDFKLINSIGHIVNITANKMKFELELTFQNAGYDMTAQQWMVLGIIYENEGISQNELAQKSKKDKTNITRILEKLEKKEFIQKVHSDEDKRVIFVFTTDEGKKTRTHLSKLAKQVIEISTKNISQKEQEICLEVLKKIYSNLS